MGSCYPCYPNCKKCTEFGTCSETVDSGNECSEGFYVVTADGTCAACDGSCLTCRDTGASECTSCRESYVKSTSGTDPGQCDPCHTSCATCTVTADETKCDTCRDGFYKLVNSANISCELCHPSCLTCDGAGLGACKSCRTGQKLSGGAKGFCTY